MIVFYTRSVSIAMLLVSGAICQAQAPSRITRPIDTNEPVKLPGSAHPMAKPVFDQGRLNPNLVIHGMSLIFKRSPAQQKDLLNLLAEQQDPASQNYRKWLTPERFGSRFGLSVVDLSIITNWLQSEGLLIERVGRSRTQVAFTGTVARIESVFRTQMHSYVLEGKEHFANSTDISIPSALQDVVLGVRNLDDFHPKPRNTHVRKLQVSPDFTSSISGNHFLAPEDFATIYDVTALYSAGFDGAGQKIAVLGDSAITVSNIATFRSLAGLSANNPSQVLVPNSGTATVPSAGEQVEAYLDLEWSGAIAKNASITYVYVGNNPNYSVWDALQYAIDNNIAPVISTSFGSCEPGIGQANASTIQGWAQQANSQGQTIVAPAGDSGAADCDGSSVASATQGLAVDVPASIPEVSGVGGVEFTGDSTNTFTTTYWSGTNDSIYGSALGYIPEVVWNDSAESIANGGGLAAGGGGASIFFPKPAWQTGTGVPNDGRRDVPDISLNASSFHDAYLICDGSAENGIQSCTNGFRDSQNYVDVVGGTSAGVPTFAGLVALLDQAIGSRGLGNINSTLYSLAGTAPSAFHDISSGNNKVPCTKGSVDCPNGGTIGYNAGTGYDQASGIGTIDAYNLATNWPGYSSHPNYSVSADPTSLTIASSGQSGTSTITMRASGGFSGTVTLTCAVSSASAKMGCSLSPSSISLDTATTSATAALTVTTTAPSVKLRESATLQWGGYFNLFGGLYGVVLGCISVFGSSRRRPRKFGLAFLLFTLLAIGSGCGGGTAGTPKGNYIVTIKGASGSTTRNSSVSVSVQ